ncbi:hypothetical protein C7S15_7986 [Burkholderia cepacia]|nr:hypothetical protein [Burkholderia cepacia]
MPSIDRPRSTASAFAPDAVHGDGAATSRAVARSIPFRCTARAVRSPVRSPV